jgi:legumain
VLKDHGVNEDNIIVMMYDDIVNDAENPVPGKLFNHPNGSDLYEGLKIDYRREAVNKNNLMAILKGDATGVKGGNGKVLTR